MTTPRETDAADRRRARWIWSGLAIALVLAATSLWAKNGQAMFVDMLIAGWTACFG